MVGIWWLVWLIWSKPSNYSIFEEGKSVDWQKNGHTDRQTEFPLDLGIENIFKPKLGKTWTHISWEVQVIPMRAESTLCLTKSSCHLSQQSDFNGLTSPSLYVCARLPCSTSKHILHINSTMPISKRHDNNQILIYGLTPLSSTSLYCCFYLFFLTLQNVTSPCISFQFFIWYHHFNKSAQIS